MFASGPLFQARKLFAGYGDAEILHGLDFELPASGVSALVGPGGSGKTTLLRLLAGRETEGFWSTGALTLSLEPSLFMPQPVIPRPIGDFRERPSFVGRCAEISQALKSHPSGLLVFDEPADVLDELCQERFADALRRRHQTQPIVLATHNLQFLRRAADYVVFLVDGCLIEAAKVEDFFERPCQERTRSFLRTGS